MPERLLIIGAGAQSRYVINTVSLRREQEIIGLVDTFSNPSIWGKVIDGYEVLGGIEIVEKFPPASNLKVICAIADISVKRQIVQTLTNCGYEFINVIHPDTSIAQNVRFGTGNIINARVVIESGTIIGNHVIIHAGCVVEHDNTLEDFVNLAPGVTTAGRVKIKPGAIIYTGASIIPDVTVGEYAIIGAGSVVIKNVQHKTKVVGVPAHEI